MTFIERKRMIYYLDVVVFSEIFLWLFHDFKFVDRFHYRVTKVHEVGAHTKRRRWQMVKFVFQAECLSMYMCVHMCVNLINMWNTHHCIIIIFIPFIALTYTMLNTYPWDFTILKAFSMKLHTSLMNPRAADCRIGAHKHAAHSSGDGKNALPIKGFPLSEF